MIFLNLPILLPIFLSSASCTDNKKDAALNIALKALQADKLRSDSLVIKFDSMDLTYTPIKNGII